MTYGPGWDEAKCAEARKSKTKPSDKDCPKPKREKSPSAAAKAIGRPLT